MSCSIQLFQPVILSPCWGHMRKRHQLSELHWDPHCKAHLWKTVMSEKEELVSKWRFYLFLPINTGNKMRFSSVAAVAAHWLGCLWHHQAVVREKRDWIFPCDVAQESTFNCSITLTFALWENLRPVHGSNVRILLKSLFLTTSSRNFNTFQWIWLGNFICHKHWRPQMIWVVTECNCWDYQR